MGNPIPPITPPVPCNAYGTYTLNFSDVNNCACTWPSDLNAITFTLPYKYYTKGSHFFCSDITEGWQAILYCNPDELTVVAVFEIIDEEPPCYSEDYPYGKAFESRSCFFADLLVNELLAGNCGQRVAASFCECHNERGATKSGYGGQVHINYHE